MLVTLAAGICACVEAGATTEGAIDQARRGGWYLDGAGRYLEGAGHLGDAGERHRSAESPAPEPTRRSGSTNEQMSPETTGRVSEPDAGQGTVEYAAILATLALLAIVAALFLGSKIDGLFRREVDPSTFLPPQVGAECDPSYSGWCIPSPPPDLDCDDLDAMGVHGEVKVVGADEHDLDSDGDGIACN